MWNFKMTKMKIFFGSINKFSRINEMLSHSYVQNFMYQTGCFVQKNSLAVFTIVCGIFSICLFGLQYVRIETDIVKLWVSEGGRLNEELNYFSILQRKYANMTWSEFDDKHFIREESDPKMREIPEDEVVTSGYQVLIQTARKEFGQRNLLTKNGLLEHVGLMEEIMHLRVRKYGVDWALSDICFKPGALDINSDSVAYSIKPTLERLIPCIWITPIDCFFEGSKPIGPHPPIDTNAIPMVNLLRLAFPDLPAQVTWSNINPEKLVKEICSNFNIGTMMNFFLRTGINEGYLTRPCIDPLDTMCPSKAPNYFEACESIAFFKKYSQQSNVSIDEVLKPYESTPEVKSSDNSLMDIFGALLMSDTKSGRDVKERSVKESDCEKHRESFLHWMKHKYLEALQIFPTELMPVFPDYGKVMRNGCRGFAQNVMNWPTDMIMGGVHDRGESIEAEALQSVILVASATDVYKRIKESETFGRLKIDVAELPDELRSAYADKASYKNGDYNSSSLWSPLVAREVLIAWQRHFTESIYNHRLNFLADGANDRTVHPLASTSISDMLSEFCNFNFLIIFVGYFVMLLYAVYSQVRWSGCCLMSINAATGLAFAGVLTVTYASIAGLGLSTWFRIEFNAATTQIVPFLTLGIGVDNMFMLLHNYPQVPISAKNDEIGMLMKETGMSILMTSVNNILSFLTGTILPIPALRSFCTQSSLLLTFNLIAILTIFPAIISWDLNRKKRGRRDLCCCLTSDEWIDQPSYESPYGFDLSGGILTPAQDLLIMPKSQYHGLVSVVDKDDEDEECDDVQPWTLRAFLRNYYIPFLGQPCVKFSVVVICMFLFAGGLFGIRQSTIGLELSDVLPDNTAPAAFLKARDKYFSFYPMFAVLRGENIDFPRQQHLIRGLRDEIGKSRFIIKLKGGEPSERYWLGMFSEWLQGMQKKLDAAKELGMLDDYDNAKKKNFTRTPDMDIAYSLACSYGDHYDCSRAGNISLIDESGTINSEGFYNYLYGWHEYESMFYAVSQASFYPKFYKLKQGPNDNKYRYYIPPAPKPLFSRIPFYLTGLKDTPVIVQMIKEIRTICENYSSQGLDNFPEGIAFTFWEQYLDLNTNLMKAIGIISFAVFCVISILLFNPWAACCIIVILLMMTVELAGFLGLCQIKFNPVSAVSLITAVGIGVEFTAHVVFAFLVARGTRNERMAEAIDRVFVPVIHGALSTLLGIIMLGFSEFEFVFKYFFIVMSALIIIGLINGLALFPVLLSLIGPPCENPNSAPRDDTATTTTSDAGGSASPLHRTSVVSSRRAVIQNRRRRRGCTVSGSGLIANSDIGSGSGNSNNNNNGSSGSSEHRINYFVNV